MSTAITAPSKRVITSKFATWPNFEESKVLAIMREAGFDPSAKCWSGGVEEMRHVIAAAITESFAPQAAWAASVSDDELAAAIKAYSVYDAGEQPMAMHAALTTFICHRRAMAQAEPNWESPPPAIDARLGVWLTSGSDDLNPHTKNLVVRFARAMAKKLLAAEVKYGYTDGWRTEDWMDECRAQLRKHIDKGDPVDVANYCAFLWYHKESTASPPVEETFLKIERDGNFLICEAEDLPDMLGDDDGPYTLTLVAMTRQAFEELPDFEGF